MRVCDSVDVLGADWAALCIPAGPGSVAALPERQLGRVLEARKGGKRRIAARIEGNELFEHEAASLSFLQHSASAAEAIGERERDHHFRRPAGPALFGDDACEGLADLVAIPEGRQLQAIAGFHGEREAPELVVTVGVARAGGSDDALEHAEASVVLGLPFEWDCRGGVTPFSRDEGVRVRVVDVFLAIAARGQNDRRIAVFVVLRALLVGERLSFNPGFGADAIAAHDLAERQSREGLAIVIVSFERCALSRGVLNLLAGQETEQPVIEVLRERPEHDCFVVASKLVVTGDFAPPPLGSRIAVVVLLVFGERGARGGRLSFNVLNPARPEVTVADAPPTRVVISVLGVYVFVVRVKTCPGSSRSSIVSTAPRSERSSSPGSKVVSIKSVGVCPSPSSFWMPPPKPANVRSAGSQVPFR